MFITELELNKFQAFLNKDHMVFWLLFSFITIGVLMFFGLKNKWSFKTATKIMVGTAFFSEFIRIFTHIQGVNVPAGESKWAFYENGGVLLAKTLPLHLCSILIFVEFYLLWGKNEKVINFLKNFLVPIGIFGGVLSLVLQTSGNYFWDFETPMRSLDPYQYFAYHLVLVWYAVYLLVTKEVTLGLKDFKNNIIAMAILAICMIWINGALGVYETNYCFVVAPPAKNLPFLNLNHGWHVYFIHLCFTAVLLELVVHLPGIIKDVKALKAAK